MHSLSTFGHIVLLATTVLAAAPCHADPSPSATRQIGPVALQPQQLVVLAEHVISSEENQRWEFAATALNMLLEIYADELQAASYEKASTPARRAKIERWQRATRNLAGQLQEASVRLAEGAPFTIHVDPRQQILIAVDGKIFSVSGPNPKSEKKIESRIINEFCAYNDCSFLHTGPAPSTSPDFAAAGVWDLHENRGPAYEIGHSMRCEFSSMSNRQNKALACSEAAVELQQLTAALQQSQTQGYHIDWERLADNPPASTTSTNLVITAEGGYLQVELPRLASIHRSDWQRLIQGLRQAGGDDSGMPVIRQADRLISGAHPD